MKFLLLALLSGASAMMMPSFVNETAICEGGLCAKSSMKYELIQPSQPGYQWNDAGGYCGSWAIQRATLSKGAYISQQQVRDATSPGGGNDNEIISTNIEEALTTLHLAFEGFDYENEALPQQDAYFKWLKRQLADGNPVAWMIMWSGQRYPIYNLTPPAGMYGHVEPVIGIQSNHPLSDTHVYDDDTVVHYTDGGMNTVYKTMSTLKGSWSGVGSKAKCDSGRYCIGPYSFGWAIKGFADDSRIAKAMPASLNIDPSRSEPDIRAGKKPNVITGVLTVTGLTVGSNYEIYRWDAIKDAFTYDKGFKKAAFRASSTEFVFKDPEGIASDGTTYYRAVEL